MSALCLEHQSPGVYAQRKHYSKKENDELCNLAFARAFGAPKSRLHSDLLLHLLGYLNRPAMFMSSATRGRRYLRLSRMH